MTSAKAVRVVVSVIVVAFGIISPNPSFAQARAGDPFQARVTLEILPGSTQNQATVSVPAGRLLVIEHVSSRVQGPGGDRYIAQLQTTGLINWLVYSFQGTFSSIDLLTASHPIRVYTDTSPLFVVTRTGVGGNVFAEINVSGFLEPVPPAEASAGSLFQPTAETAAAVKTVAPAIK